MTDGCSGISCVRQHRTIKLPKLVSDETRQNRPEVVSHVRDLILRASPDAINGALYRMMTRPDSGPQLTEIRWPTLTSWAV